MSASTTAGSGGTGGQDYADQVVAAVREVLPAGVRIERHGRSRVTMKFKPAWFSSASSTLWLSELIDEASPDTLEDALREVLDSATGFVNDHKLTWPGLLAGTPEIALRRKDGFLVATLTDGAHPSKHTVTLRSIALPPEPPQADEREWHALLDELRHETSEVDQLAPWLLRIGIDHSGELELNHLWDLAVRALALADLQRANRLTETSDTIEVDQDATGIGYQDAAAAQLASGQWPSEFAWVRDGRLRASDVAASLVSGGEWTVHFAALSSGWHTYHCPPQRHVTLRRRLAHTYDGDITPLNDGEAALAVLGHALEVVRPTLVLRHGSRHSANGCLEPQDCGALAPLVTAVVTEMRAQHAESSANRNTTW